jgi:outer membrane lipoprotein-sorting protein
MVNTMSRRNAFFALLVLLSVAVSARAEDLTGEQIARRVIPSNTFESDAAGKTKMKMILIDKSGKQSERAIEILSRRKDGLMQNVVRFRSPQDIAGTAFLILEKKEGSSEQYIYLPRLKRTRRIVGRERESSFVGSDFAYTDIRRLNPDDGTHKRLPDEKIGNDPVYVLESIPKKSTKAPYGKIETWVRKSDYLPLRTRFYNPEGKLVKTLYSRRVQMVEGKAVVKEFRMDTAATGHATVIVIDDVEKRDNLPDSAFTPTALEHP